MKENDKSPADRAKRSQILDGARRVFLEKGFDGASVADIVKAAKVSKGTVYAYFPSKEKLFETMIFEDRRGQAERLFDIGPGQKNPREVLTGLGEALVSMTTQPDQMAYARMVISASGKFPEAGRSFYEAGPQFGINKLADYLASMDARGVLRVPDPETTAMQFIDLCHTGSIKPLLFGMDCRPDSAAIAARVAEAVAMIMTACEVPPKASQNHPASGPRIRGA